MVLLQIRNVLGFWSMRVFIEMCMLPLGCSKYLFRDENWYIHEAWHLLQLDIYSLCSLDSPQEIMEKAAFPFLFMWICRWIVCCKYIVASSHCFVVFRIVPSIKNVMNGRLVVTLYIFASIFLALGSTCSNWYLFCTKIVWVIALERQSFSGCAVYMTVNFRT